MGYQTCSQNGQQFVNLLNVFLAAECTSQCSKLQTPKLPLTACVGKPGKKDVRFETGMFQIHSCIEFGILNFRLGEFSNLFDGARRE